MLPYKKAAFLECANCKNLAPEDEMTEAEISEARQAKRAVRAPVWTYAVFVIFAAFVAFAIYGDLEQQKQTAVYLERPAEGDLAILQVRDGYQVIKLAGVKDGVVEFHTSRATFKSTLTAEQSISGIAENGDFFAPDIGRAGMADYRRLPVALVVRPVGGN